MMFILAELLRILPLQSHIMKVSFLFALLLIAGLSETEYLLLKDRLTHPLHHLSLHFLSYSQLALKVVLDLLEAGYQCRILAKNML